MAESRSVTVRVGAELDEATALITRVCGPQDASTVVRAALYIAALEDDPHKILEAVKAARRPAGWAGRAAAGC